MKRQPFTELLQKMQDVDRFLCVGLDLDLRSANRRGVIHHAREIIGATFLIAGAYKVNVGFALSDMEKGLYDLRIIRTMIGEMAPRVPFIVDGKWGDTYNTNKRYAFMAFNQLGADAVTVQFGPGEEALMPFLEREDKGVFVVCRPSSPGAEKFYDLHLAGYPAGYTIYEHIACTVATEWNTRGNCGLVVGATCPAVLRRVRNYAPNVPILMPGIGVQGGTIREAVPAAMDAHGRGILPVVARNILFAGVGPDIARPSARAATLLNDEINQYRMEMVR